jgi:hypothetical protein
MQMQKRQFKLSSRGIFTYHNEDNEYGGRSWRHKTESRDDVVLLLLRRLTIVKMYLIKEHKLCL